MNAEDLEDWESSKRQDDSEQEEHRVASVLWIMFSTPLNFSFFLGVVLSGMAKGVIDTFLFIWSVHDYLSRTFEVELLCRSRSSADRMTAGFTSFMLRYGPEPEFHMLALSTESYVGPVVYQAGWEL